MKKIKIVSAILFLMCNTPLLAQIYEPVNWKFYARKGEDDCVMVYLSADIEPGWHVYSQAIPDGGPLPTSIHFLASDEYELIDDVNEEGELIKGYDPAFQMDLGWFERSVAFLQKIKPMKSTATVSGTVEYMVCNNRQCLPPDEVDFSIVVE